MVKASTLWALIIGVGSYYAAKWYINLDLDEGICVDTTVLRQHGHDEVDSLIKSFPLECYFSKNYDEATKSFVQMAQEKDASEIFALPIDADSETLETMVAVFNKRANPKQVLLHLSGTHGTEAFVGSAVQLAAMDVLTEAALGDVMVVMVHALNPYGFKHLRRYNEDNVDLNRNFLTQQEWDFVLKRHPNYAHYVDLDGALNPTRRPFANFYLNEVYGLCHVMSSVLLHGVLSIKRALVSGNYHKASGVGYGGSKLSQSAVNLISLIDRLNLRDSMEAVVVLDVHSGLGPPGVDTLMFDASPSLHNAATIEAIFPTQKAGKAVFGGIKVPEKPFADNALNQQVDKDAAAVAAGYELTMGMVTKGFCGSFLLPSDRQIDHICVTQEFGTVSTIHVGKYLVDENYAHHHGNEEEKAYYKAKLRDCFYVNRKWWKRQTVERGVRVFYQGLKFLYDKQSLLQERKL